MPGSYDLQVHSSGLFCQITEPLFASTANRILDLGPCHWEGGRSLSTYLSGRSVPRARHIPLFYPLHRIRWCVVRAPIPIFPFMPSTHLNLNDGAQRPTMPAHYSKNSTSRPIR